MEVACSLSVIWTLDMLGSFSCCMPQKSSPGGGFKYFCFHPYLGKWSKLTNIFQMGWKHHLDLYGGHKTPYVSRRTPTCHDSLSWQLPLHRVVFCFLTAGRSFNISKDGTYTYHSRASGVVTFEGCSPGGRSKIKPHRIHVCYICLHLP